MADSWQDVSEVVFGRVMSGEENSRFYDPNMFVPPYNKGMSLIQKDASQEELISAIGVNAFRAAVSASEVYQEITGIDWPTKLSMAFNSFQLGNRMEDVGRRLKRGESFPDSVELIDGIKKISNPEATGLVLASQLDYESYQEIQPCGWEAIDEHIGGIPQAGIIMVGGDTGLGKSFWLMKMVNSFLHQYPDKVASIYSLEMPSEQWIKRAVDAYPDFMDILPRLLISDKPVTIRDVGAEVARSNAGFVGVDYVEYLVAGEPSTTAYDEIYIKTNAIARDLQLPFFMLGQLNRTQYTDPIPRKYQFRFSNMGISVASQVVCLARFNSDNQLKDKDSGQYEFRYEPNSMYSIYWKSRAGWKENKTGPGAIITPIGDHLWTESGNWSKHMDTPIPMRATIRG